ncbi:MAG: phosphatase PAP2 family protein, partial [Bacteroidales bacterium]|nr:phosphatase PAP2 family protein [Bacteroidales bacterium]
LILFGFFACSSYSYVVFLTAYSRIYCGVHYPGDVLCGGLLGVVLGLLIYMLYCKLKKRFPNTLSL